LEIVIKYFDFQKLKHRKTQSSTKLQKRNANNFPWATCQDHTQYSIN
jgi:hypothetical protein